MESDYNRNMDTPPQLDEVYLSVDIETAGPNPGEYSLLTIGACGLGATPSTFYVEIQPVNMKFVPEALAISRISMERLAERGLSPREAMLQFESWIKEQTTNDQRPVFLAFNAAFDWMFVNDYFHRYLGRNPFGHAPLDIKSFYMGLSGVPWSETSMRFVGPRYLRNPQLTHHALRDAMDQADIFRMMLVESRKKHSTT